MIRKKKQLTYLLGIMLLLFVMIMRKNEKNHSMKQENDSLGSDLINRDEPNFLKEIEEKNILEANKKLYAQSRQEQLKMFKSAKVIDNNSLSFYKQIQRRKYNVDCRSIVEWDVSEMRQAKRELFRIRKNSELRNQFVPLIPDSNFIFEKSMCEYYR